MNCAKSILKLLGYVAPIIALIFPLWSQQTTSPGLRGAQEVTINNSHLVAHGEVLASGTNEMPSGKLKVKSYRLERIKLTHTLTLGTKGELHYDYLLRLIVTGQQFDSNFTIWVDDRPFSAVPNAEHTEIRADFPMGTNFLEEGATLSVSDGSSCGYKAGDETVLPEKLSLPPELRAAPVEENRIRLSTIPHSREHNGRPAVAIGVTTRQMVADGRNEMPAIQIGKQYFLGGGMLHGFGALIPYDVFFQIPENAQVFVGWGPCPMGGESVGRLHKGDLDH
jgi:hypothetical protein